MARPCTTCDHPELETINRQLVDSVGTPKRFRRIGERFGLGERAVERHAATHLTDGLARATVKHAELIEQTKDMDVLATLGRVAQRMELYFEAAHRWLQDPDDPTSYTLAPRETDVLVIWEEEVPKDSGEGFRTVKRKERLTDLLKRCGLKGGPGAEEILMVELNTGNPRKLFLDGVTAGKPLYELLGKALGQIKPDPAATVNVLVLPETKAHLDRVASAFEACAAAGCTRCADAWEGK